MNVNLPPISFQTPLAQQAGALAAGEKGDGGGDGTGYEPGEEEEPDEEEDEEEANLWRFQKLAPPFRIDGLEFSDEVREVLAQESADSPVSFAQWAPGRPGPLGLPVDPPPKRSWQFSRPRRRPSPSLSPRVGPEPSEVKNPRPCGLRFEKGGFELEPQALFQVIQDGYIQELEFLPSQEGLKRDPDFVPCDKPRRLSLEEVEVLTRNPPPPPLVARPRPQPQAPPEPAPPPEKPPYFQIAPRSRRPGHRGAATFAPRPAATVEPPPPPPRRLAPEPPPHSRFSRSRTASPEGAYQPAAHVPDGPKTSPCEQEGLEVLPERGFLGQAPSSAGSENSGGPARRRDFSRRSGARAVSGQRPRS